MPTNEIRSFEDLETWQRALEVTLRTYKVVENFPRSERFELSSQMRRAAVSIPSNVAEGQARKLPKPFLNHVLIALGSHAELVTCLIIARHLGFITAEQLEQERRVTDSSGQLLHGLARSLEDRIAAQRVPKIIAFAALFVGLAATVA